MNNRQALDDLNTISHCTISVLSSRRQHVVVREIRFTQKHHVFEKRFPRVSRLNRIFLYNSGWRGELQEARMPVDAAL